MTLAQLIAQISPPDAQAQAAARARQDQLTKPQGSLGRLETLAIQIAGIRGQARPQLRHKAIVVMAGDHGVVAEGISAFPQEVTPQMVMNFLHGGAAINALASHAQARVIVVDMGVAAKIPPHPQLISKKIAPGTANIAQGPAMSRQQAEQALLAGAEIITAQQTRGLDILGLGEMGIGNTTPAAAIAAALTQHAPAEIVGRGTGLDDAGVQHKSNIVQQALALNQPDPEDALDVLAKVGGYEIAGLVGATLAAAAQGIPVMVDGFITTAAVMLAVKLAPQVQQYLIASHQSQEKGHALMLTWLGLEPLLKLDLRLGEGSGAALGITLADAACKALDQMATFAEAAVAGKKA
jgi:nicotinate-nucleotide--dimethylbenzimidazole phosphoribosyltransferase